MQSWLALYPRWRQFLWLLHVQVRFWVVRLSWKNIPESLAPRALGYPSKPLIDSMPIKHKEALTMKKLIAIAAAASVIGVGVYADSAIASQHRCTIRTQTDEPVVHINCTVRLMPGGRVVFIDNDSDPNYPRYLSTTEGGSFTNSGQFLHCLTSPDNRYTICPSRELMLMMTGNR